MKIFIITEAGHTVGGGHLARCLAICQAFKSHVETKSLGLVFVVNGDRSATKAVPDEYFISRFDWVKDQGRLLSLLGSEDIAVIDSYLGNRPLYNKISKKVRLAVYIDDNKRMDYPGGMVVNAALYAENLGYKKDEKVQYLFGPRYMPLRKPFWNSKKIAVRPKLKRILITFGSSDPAGLTEKVMDLLSKGYPGLEKTVIVGQCFKNVKDVIARKDHRTKLVMSPDAAGMKRQMRACDAAVTAAGQTIYELACLGVPSIAVPVAENQRRNAEAWKRSGFVGILGLKSGNIVKRELINALSELKTKRARDRRSGISALVDGNGANRLVARIISERTKQDITIRLATIKDVKSAFDLSNDHIVRKNSFCRDKFEWEHHFEWFKNRLKSPDTVFLVVGKENEFCGQVRFDLDPKGRGATVNISLSKRLRGLGLSSSILDLSIKELLKIKKGIRRIDAYVDKENIASLKMFKRSGFINTRGLLLKGRETGLLIRKIK